MRIRPSMLPTLVLAAITGAFMWLGFWQLDRAAEKHRAEAQFDAAPTLRFLPATDAVLPYARVRLTGTFDARRHVLVDNRVLNGRPGVHVLTPFMTATGGVTVLVNRGWLPLGPDRTVLPEVPLTDGTVEISGHLEGPRNPGVMLGEAERFRAGAWPQLWTYPDMGALAEAFGEQLYHLILYLDADSVGGFAGRAWTPHVVSPGKHTAYAVQWFALAATGVIAWLVLGLKRGRESQA